MATLVENFEVEQDVVTRSTERLGFSDWMALHRLPLPALRIRRSSIRLRRSRT